MDAAPTTGDDPKDEGDKRASNESSRAAVMLRGDDAVTATAAVSPINGEVSPSIPAPPILVRAESICEGVDPINGAEEAVAPAVSAVVVGAPAAPPAERLQASTVEDALGEASVLSRAKKLIAKSLEVALKSVMLECLDPSALCGYGAKSI